MKTFIISAAAPPRRAAAAPRLDSSPWLRCWLRGARDAMRYQQWRAAVLMIASLGCAPPLQHAAATTVAPPPQPQQQPSSRCKSDLDCSLNGICSSSAGTCVCDKPWGGSGCGELRYKVTPAAGRDLFPINRSHNTWNGPIVGPVGGQYHLYDPLYGNFTGIKSLFRVEWIMHGVADQITGPYDWKSKPTIPGGICCCACRHAAMPASCGACVRFRVLTTAPPAMPPLRNQSRVLGL
eukprot:COSAG01_NODE_5703_length_4087_cov_14.995737_1_plen_237_part_00